MKPWAIRFLACTLLAMVSWSVWAGPPALYQSRFPVGEAELLLTIRNQLAAGSQRVTIQNAVIEAQDLTDALVASGGRGEVWLLNCSVLGVLSILDVSETIEASEEMALRLEIQSGTRVALVRWGFSFTESDVEVVGCSLSGMKMIRDWVQDGRTSMQDLPSDTRRLLLDWGQSPPEWVVLENGISFYKCYIGGIIFDTSIFVEGGNPSTFSISYSECEDIGVRDSDFRISWALSDSECSQDVGIERTVFRRSAYLQACRFHARVWLDDVDFRDRALLSSEFTGFTRLAAVRFEGTVDLAGARFDAGLDVSDVSFAAQASATRASLFELASHSWDAIGRRGEADRYFVLAMRAHRAAKPLVARAIETVVADWMCGYGTSWKRVLVSWAIVIAAGTLATWAGEGIQAQSGGPPIRSFWLSLYFSIVTFTTLGYGDYRPRGPFKIVADATALLGAFMMALLVAVFARQFMR